jgi:hypothetical protein
VKLVVPLLLCVVSCLPGSSLGRLLPDGDPAPAEIREACTVTAVKCTRCHSIDRVLVAQVSSPHQWEAYVARMRRMTASGITEEDMPRIVQCLVYRSGRNRQEDDREAIVGN